jgi:hypothetical protein
MSVTRLARTSVVDKTPDQLWLWYGWLGRRRGEHPEHVREFVLALQGASVWFNPDDSPAWARFPHRVDVLRYNAFMRDPFVKHTRALLQSVPDDLDVLADKLMQCGHWLGEPLALWLRGSRMFRRQARALFRASAPDLRLFQGWRRCDQRIVERHEVERVAFNHATWGRLREAAQSSTITPVNGGLHISTGNEPARFVAFPTGWTSPMEAMRVAVVETTGLNTKRVGDSLVVLPTRADT